MPLRDQHSAQCMFGTLTQAPATTRLANPPDSQSSAGVIASVAEAPPTELSETESEVDAGFSSGAAAATVAWPTLAELGVEAAPGHRGLAAARERRPPEGTRPD